MSTPATPLSAHAYGQIKRLIIEGRLQPGDQLVVRMLAELLDLSATPVKAALSALERDGYVTAEPNRGHHVTVLHARDVRELFELREALEPCALRLAVATGPDASWLAGLRASTGAQRAAAASDDRATYNELNQEFHRALWRLADNRRLDQVMDNVMGQMSLATTFTSRAPGRLERAIEEHATMVDLLESGDADTLATHAASHIRESYTAYLHMVGQGP